MTNGRRPLLSTLSILVFWTGTHAIATETSGTSPYQAIVERNVFGLKPPPPPPSPEANKPPPPKILLQGITTILNNKRALFKLQVPPKPGEPPKGEQSFILAEGQRDGEIEVLEIDDKAGRVKVNNFGTIMDLDFENNGIKTAGAPAPGAAGKPGGFVPGPPPNPFAPAGGAGAIPNARPMHLPPTGAAVSPGGSGSYGGTAVAANYGTTRSLTTYTAVPTTPTYGSSPAIITGGSAAAVVTGGSGATTLTVPLGGAASTTGTPQKSFPPELPMSPEEQTILDAAYTMKNKDAIEKGLMPSVPGSNPLLDSGTTSGQTTTTPKTPSAPPLPPGSAHAPIVPGAP